MTSPRPQARTGRLQRAVALALVLVGAFLTTVGVLGFTYLPDKMVKVPLTVDLVTHLEGQAEMGGASSPTPIKITSHTLIDSAASTDTLALWRTGSCIVVADPGVPDCVRVESTKYRLISAGTNAFVTDRVTALGVNDGPMIADDVNPTQGIVNKFPFDSERKTYPYWNSTLKKPVEAAYEKTEDVKGLETYVYEITVPEGDAEIAPGIDGRYSEETEVYVEPLSGTVVNQVTNQRRMLPDGTPVMIIQAHFTDEQVSKSVNDAKPTVTQLKLLRTVPWVGVIVGPFALLVGVLLLLFGRASRTRRGIVDLEGADSSGGSGDSGDRVAITVGDGR